jgi:hypothetical protein
MSHAPAELFAYDVEALTALVRALRADDQGRRSRASASSRR